MVRLVAENFEVLSVTVWLLDDDKNKLVFAASTALSESRAGDLTEPSGMSAADSIPPQPTVSVDIESSTEHWAETLKQCHPGYFAKKGDTASAFRWSRVANSWRDNAGRPGQHRILFG